MRVWIGLLLVGCTAERAEPEPQRPLPQVLDLTVQGSGVRGLDRRFVVSGLPAGASVQVYFSDGPEGSGTCLDTASCLDLEPGGGPSGGYYVSDSATADGSGVATWTQRIPPSVAVGNWRAQAVSQGLGSPLVDAPVFAVPENVMLMSLGYTTSCGVSPRGVAVCWGDDGSRAKWMPTSRWRDIAQGDFYGCGLTDDFDVRCWGRPSFDVVANPTTAPLVSLDAGNQFACGLQQDGTPVCWGEDIQGAVSGTPTSPLTEVSAGQGVACGLDAAGALTCWGAITVSEPGPYTQVSAHWAACGLREDGEIDCWSRAPGSALAPPPAGPWRKVAVGGAAWACGLREDRSIECWGRGSVVGSEPQQRGRWSILEAGDFAACAARRGGAVRCWGDDGFGQTSIPRLRAPEDTAAPGGDSGDTADSGVGGDSGDSGHTADSGR